jgi:hypothetical protein
MVEEKTGMNSLPRANKGAEQVDFGAPMIQNGRRNDLSRSPEQIEHG